MKSSCIGNDWKANYAAQEVEKYSSDQITLMNAPSIVLLRQAISRSIQELKSNHGCLFGMPIEENAHYDARKLHEVCINHKFAECLAREILPLLGDAQKMFVDIEFNREGGNFKQLEIDGKVDTVRPDIIIHNRKSNGDKFNLLIAECKKCGASDEDLQKDVKKIKALIQDPRYHYHFGLRVIYGVSSVKGTLFYIENGSIKEESIGV